MRIVTCENDDPKKVLRRLTVEAYRKGLKIKSEKLVAYNLKTNKTELLFKIKYLERN